MESWVTKRYERGWPLGSLVFDVVLCRCLTGLSPPVKYFTDRSKAVLLCGSFMFFLSCVCNIFVHVCLFVPCGHLLGKG